MKKSTRLAKWQPAATQVAKPVSKAFAFSTLAKVEEEYGGREALREQLLFAPQTPKSQRLVDLLFDPGRERDSLRVLCSAAEITPFEVLGMLRESAEALYRTQADQMLAAKLPGVMADVADKAVDTVVPCPCTIGIGGSFEPDPRCPDCKGRGVVFREANFEQQKLIFESAKLLPKAQVKMDNSSKTLVVNSSKGDIFDAFVKSTDAVLLPPSTTAPVTIEVTDVEEVD